MYVGQYGVMDEGNGLLYMRARYYDPDLGRFVSKDPIRYSSGNLNFYAYVGNNSVNFTDPNGLLGWDSLIRFGVKRLINSCLKKATGDPMERGGKQEKEWLRQRYFEGYLRCLQDCSQKYPYNSPQLDDCILNCILMYQTNCQQNHL
jgi:RHS repeat-associated protein